MKLCMALMLLFSTGTQAQDFGEILDWVREKIFGSTLLLAERPSLVEFRLGMEAGLLLPVKNQIQLGGNGTLFDYVEEGGQDLVFPFARYEAEIGLKGRHRFLFLYQPLELETRVNLDRDVTVDGLVFPEATPVRLLYSFPYYRLSYLYDFFQAPRSELSLGFSLQLRRALFEFASLDGALFRSRRNMGPVPLLNFRFRAPFPKRVWLAGDAQGIYVPTRFFIDGDDDGVGTFLGAGLRLGLGMKPYFQPFAGIRYIGGGSRSNNPNFRGPGDGYSENWIHYTAFNLGFNFQ